MNLRWTLCVAVLGFVNIANAGVYPLDTTLKELSCVTQGGGVILVRLSDGRVLDTHADLATCEDVRLAAHGGVVCAWFTPSRPVGPGAWKETGWRPMSVKTELGLGRKPFATRDECLSASSTANGGVVCTNTGLGAKAANVETNQWCGASSQLSYCTLATEAAFDNVVCSFPSSGTGAENGWVRTRVTDQCDYQTNQMSLKDCSASITR